jgi:hypothetical protein
MPVSAWVKKLVRSGERFDVRHFLNNGPSRCNGSVSFCATVDACWRFAAVFAS